MIERGLRKRKQENKENETPSETPKKTRSILSLKHEADSELCICCWDEFAEDEALHCASEQSKENLRFWTAQTEKWDIHARLATSHPLNPIWYHLSCYMAVKRAAISELTKHDSINGSKDPEFDPLVMAQLLAYIQDCVQPQTVSFLKKLYLKNSPKVEGELHSTRFKQCLLERLGPDWTTHRQGKDIYITHTKVIGEILAKECLSDKEAEKIVSVAILLRNMVLQQQPQFSGSLTSTSNTPVALISFIKFCWKGQMLSRMRLQEKAPGKELVAL
jgi:hypothetical protein